MKCSSCGRNFSANITFCPFCRTELSSDRILMFRKIGTAWFIGSITGLILGAIIGHANSDGYIDKTYSGLSLGCILGGILFSGICISTLAHKGRGVAIATGYFLCSMIGGTFVYIVGDILFPQHIIYDQNMIPVGMSDTQITVTTVLGFLLGWWILLRIGTHSFKKGK